MNHVLINRQYPVGREKPLVLAVSKYTDWHEWDFTETLEGEQAQRSGLYHSWVIWFLRAPSIVQKHPEFSRVHSSLEGTSLVHCVRVPAVGWYHLLHSTPTHPTLPSSLAIIFSVAYISYLIPDHIQAPLTAAPGSWKKRHTFLSRHSSTMELALTLALWVRTISALRSIPSLQFQGFGPHSDPGVCTSMGKVGCSVWLSQDTWL